MIEAKNITKIYKDGDEEFVALKNINLKIEDGDFLIIKGTLNMSKGDDQVNTRVTNTLSHPCPSQEGISGRGELRKNGIL